MIAAFVPDAEDIFISNFTMVAISGSVMVAVIGAVVAAATIVVSLMPKDDLRKVSGSGHGLADELWAFEFVVVAGVVTLAFNIIGNALIDQTATAGFAGERYEPSLFPQPIYVLVSAALLMTTMLSTARLVRSSREIAELRLDLDEETDPGAG